MVPIIELNGDNVIEPIKQRLLRGSFFSLAPEGTPFESLLNFDTGGLLPEALRYRVGQYEVSEVKSQANLLANKLIEISQGVPNSLIILREPYKTMEETKNELLVVGKSLFKTFSNLELNADAITNAITYYTVSWSFLSIITSVNSANFCFDVLMGCARCIAVNAYDGEGYVVWTEDHFQSIIDYGEKP
jgi:hypothetical protein